jgi:hypothetical protein
MGFVEKKMEASSPNAKKSLHVSRLTETQKLGRPTDSIRGRCKAASVQTIGL